MSSRTVKDTQRNPASKNPTEPAERARDRDRDRETDRERDRDRDRQTDRHRGRDNNKYSGITLLHIK